jgi:hypothetical protein
MLTQTTNKATVTKPRQLTGPIKHQSTSSKQSEVSSLTAQDDSTKQFHGNIKVDSYCYRSQYQIKTHGKTTNDVSE